MSYKDKEKEKQHSKEYYWKNKEKIQQRCKRYRQKNKEKIRLKNKEWYQKNKDRIAQWQKEYNKEHRKERNQYNNEYYHKHRKTDVKFRLNDSIRTYVCRSLKGKKAGRKLREILEYSTNDLIKHLEAQFDENMSWDNYGSYWEVDHKKPIYLFNFTSPEDLEFKECWALKNLQPMEKIANRKKGNRYHHL